MPKSILLTGSTGFVGTNLVKSLTLKSDYIVKSVVRHAINKDDELFFEVGDINASSDYMQALNNTNIVIHCAARAHVMDDNEAEPLALYREVNTAGTINLAKQAIDLGIKRFIFISSIKVNGEASILEKPFFAGDPHAPQDDYGLSKSEAELQLMELAKDSDMEVVIIRPTLVYGPGVKANFASLMGLVAKGIPLPFGCITNNKRSLVSVDNLVDLIITCIDHPKAANQVFLVSDDHDISTSEMVREMAIALNKPAWQLPVPVWCYKLAGKLFNKSAVVDRLTGSLQVDISHTKDTLGWRPPQSLRDGFKQTAEAFLHSKKNSGKA
ncbi:UDP-glucose 4-epimerase family protein [Vibrio cholerae]|uniref:SDR family oxidoreductase n=1 Tax=Vibrio cholerae TaxID=666 RepID=A0A7Z7YFS1_VIBCL|nr:SDR family oxidoreductase [Vibrio cholerae]PNV71074.1 UDP-glucose 4-epimerase [Vibrio cholerae]TBM44720.1 SDR family oxidoreductase [Vibrio cholerae]CQB50483.1 UDP-glucose 4-epimerase [Vibrio cholerae]